MLRADIEAAYKALDGKGQSAINGLKAPGQVKKALDQLESFIGDEPVMALAVAKDLGPSIGAQQGMGTAASLATLTSVTKSARLLVLTENALHQVQGGGKFMSGGKPQGMSIALADIRDVRVRTSRSTAKMLSKEHILMFDYLRGGAQFQTEACEIATESQLVSFAPQLQQQVELAKALGDEQSGSQDSGSIADELTKFAQLRDSGIISDEEFEARKKKLLDS